MDLNVFCDSNVKGTFDFKCTMAGCPYTCCTNWKILVDNDCLERIKQNRSRFAKRVSRSIVLSDFHNILLLNRKNVCRFLRKKDMTCSIQNRLSEEYMPIPCREFPRVINDNGFISIRSLSIACPEAAELLLLNKNGIGFEEGAAYSFGGLDESLLYDEYLAYSECLILHSAMKILKNKSQKLQHRLGIIALMLHKAEDVPLIKENEKRLIEVIDYFSDEQNIPSFLEELNNFKCDNKTKKLFEDFIITELQTQNIMPPPFKNKYSRHMKQLVRFISYTNIFSPFNYSHVKTILDDYSYILENYIAITMYNTLFPYEHENFHYAYKYLILKFYMAVIFISQLYKNAGSISDKDVSFALSYYSRLSEHIRERSAVFYGFLDNHASFDLSSALSLIACLRTCGLS